jgi:hypothetical protein
MNARTGEWFETRHFGLLQHENVVPLRLSKWVFLTTDDDFRNVNNPPGYPVRENAYLYAYIAKSFKAALSGDPKKGSLHVWVPDNPAMGSNAAVNTKDDPVPGHFVPITQAENATAETLKAAATLRGAFKFDRLEDATPQRGRESRVFFADTGKLPTTNRGRIYQLDFNRHDPTQATLRLVLSGDPPYRDDIYNPDNLDASERVLMIQEDRESQWRDAIHNGGYSRVMEYRFSDRRLRSVARVNTPPGVPPYLNPTPCAGCRPGDWESSGIIDARHVLGQDWWLLDVQAHRSTASQPGPGPKPYPPAGTGTGEAGQLLALYVPNSQGRHDDDDDEEEEEDDD